MFLIDYNYLLWDIHTCFMPSGRDSWMCTLYTVPLYRRPVILDASMNYQARQWREKQPQFTFIVVQARLYCPLSHKQIQYQKRPKKMWIHSGFSLCFTCREWERMRENEQMQWVVNRFKVCWQYTMIMHYQNFEGDEMCAIAAKTMQSVSPSRWCYYWWHDPINTLCVRTV